MYVHDRRRRADGAVRARRRVSQYRRFLYCLQRWHVPLEDAKSLPTPCLSRARQNSTVRALQKFSGLRVAAGLCTTAQKTKHSISRFPLEQRLRVYSHLGHAGARPKFTAKSTWMERSFDIFCKTFILPVRRRLINKNFPRRGRESGFSGVPRRKTGVDRAKNVFPKLRKGQALIYDRPLPRAFTRRHTRCDAHTPLPHTRTRRSLAPASDGLRARLPVAVIIQTFVTVATRRDVKVNGKQNRRQALFSLAKHRCPSSNHSTSKPSPRTALRYSRRRMARR